MDIRSIGIPQLTGIKNYATSYSQMEEEYILSRMTFDNIGQKHNDDAKPHHPIRIDGFTLILCLEGNLSLGINLDNYEVESNSIILASPNSIIRFNNVSDKIDAYTLFVSINFLKDINLDIKTLNPVGFTKKPTPILSLSSEEISILKQYLDLMHLNSVDNTSTIYVRNIARCLMASLLYQLMQFLTNHKGTDGQEDESQPQSRRMNYVRDFMALVQKHHYQERSVGFYADKLFISPKYLSLIIKDVTGRSAAEWIDEYVILEAKNLLRFSGKNIQQVAYELNFTNQSSFGKYFKHLTGMSPSEFQRS